MKQKVKCFISLKRLETEDGKYKIIRGNKMKKPYKYEQKVNIFLESNNQTKMREIAHKFFSKKLDKKLNDPEDIDNYVAISAVME